MDDATSAVLRLPPDLRLAYLAEGGANIVYHTLATSTAHREFHGLLLRLHKAVPWIPSYATLQADYEHLIAPLFDPSQLLSQRLVAVPSAIIARCNDELRATETEPDAIASAHDPPPRPLNRHGTYLAPDEPYGLLVTDMTGEPERGVLAVELKPKWLAQSPNAPPGSTRCRTCALRAMRLHDRGRRAEADAKIFCPLDLVSGERDAVARAVRAVIAGSVAVAYRKDELVAALSDYLLTNPLLPRLRALQTEHDPAGILSVNVGEVPCERFLVATTLRDCTLFLRVRWRGGSGGRGYGGVVGEIEARLGDLDIKAPEEAKVRWWREVEGRLVDEGWYFGRDGGTAGGTGAGVGNGKAGSGVDMGLCRLERDAGP